MVVAGHTDLAPKTLDYGGDTGVVGGDYYPLGVTQTGALIHALHHAFAAEVF
jgi:hypothetical protein